MGCFFVCCEAKTQSLCSHYDFILTAFQPVIAVFLSRTFLLHYGAKIQSFRSQNEFILTSFFRFNFCETPVYNAICRFQIITLGQYSGFKQHFWPFLFDQRANFQMRLAQSQPILAGKALKIRRDLDEAECFSMKATQTPTVEEHPVSAAATATLKASGNGSFFRTTADPHRTTRRNKRNPLPKKRLPPPATDHLFLLFAFIRANQSPMGDSRAYKRASREACGHVQIDSAYLPSYPFRIRSS